MLKKKKDRRKKMSIQCLAGETWARVSQYCHRTSDNFHPTFHNFIDFLSSILARYIGKTLTSEPGHSSNDEIFVSAEQILDDVNAYVHKYSIEWNGGVEIVIPDFYIIYLKSVLEHYNGFLLMDDDVNPGKPFPC